MNPEEVSQYLIRRKKIREKVFGLICDSPIFFFTKKIRKCLSLPLPTIIHEYTEHYKHLYNVKLS